MKKGFTHESTYNESKEWYTPRYIFEALDIEFDLDPCSPGQKIVPWIPAKRHLTFLDNGLTAHWKGNIWLNPPYGADTPEWLKHLSMTGNGIALVFSRTDTKWFQSYIPKADAICFIKGRIQFISALAVEEYIEYTQGHREKFKSGGGCGAGSMLIAFGKDNAKALIKSNLGLALPVCKPHRDVQDRGRFVGEKAGASKADRLSNNENPPYNAEGRQGNLFRS